MERHSQRLRLNGSKTARELTPRAVGGGYWDRQPLGE